MRPFVHRGVLLTVSCQHVCAVIGISHRLPFSFSCSALSQNRRLVRVRGSRLRKKSRAALLLDTGGVGGVPPADSWLRFSVRRYTESVESEKIVADDIWRLHEPGRLQKGFEGKECRVAVHARRFLNCLR